MITPASTEDTFYDNITLGLPQLLETIPRVKNVTLEKRPPCERLLLNSWEQRHCCALPDDMRQFYSSTDGLNLTWCYEYSPQDIREVGKVQIRALGELCQMSALKEELELNSPTYPTYVGPVIGPKSKIVEVDNVDNIAKILMVFEDSERDPKFWLLDSSGDSGGVINNKQQWVLLAKSFSQYLRMCIVHLGLPQWQLCFSQQGMLPWAEQLFMLIAPHLLCNDHHHQTAQTVIPHQTACEPPENTIDEAIFKPKPRLVKPVFRTN